MTDTKQLLIDGATATFDISTSPEGLIDAIFEQERELLAETLSILRPDDVLFDVGANYGLYSAFAANTLSDGHVVAFEPYPPNVVALTRTVELNSAPNITTVEAALSNEEGTCQFESPETERYASAAMKQQTDPAEETYTVETRTGDELVAEGVVPSPNVVKIDVEGAEPLVIEGMAEMLDSEDCRMLFCEVHPPDEDAGHVGSIADHETTLDELLDEIQGFGFHTTRIAREGQLHVVGKKT